MFLPGICSLSPGPGKQPHSPMSPGPATFLSPPSPGRAWLSPLGTAQTGAHYRLSHFLLTRASVQGWLVLAPRGCGCWHTRCWTFCLKLRPLSVEDLIRPTSVTPEEPAWFSSCGTEGHPHLPVVWPCQSLTGDGIGGRVASSLDTCSAAFIGLPATSPLPREALLVDAGASDQA